MIRINRANVPEPAILQSERVKLARSRARNHFQRPFAQRSQIRFTFDTGIFQTEDLRRALTDLCEGKCAYCESAIGAVAPAQIDRYRPRSFAGTDRTIKRDHYWWLAYEWSNLYLCCPVCSRNKGRRFPVEGERAEQLTFGEDLLNAEKPLLLDPGADHPDDHLAFDDNGLVLAKTLRGQTTIDALGLNRSDLVNARRHELDFIRNFSRRDPNKTDAAWMQIVQQTLSNPRQAYLGAIRQFVARELKRWTGLKSEAPPIERFVDKVLGLLGAGISTASVYALVGSLPTNVPLDSQIKRLLTESFTQEESSSAFTISEERVDNAYYGKTRLVEYVEITDFRKIHSLKLRFDTSQSHLAPWTMLLGENGVGKSSVLQAIALTLIDQDYRKRLKLNPKTFIRKGARSAKVRVWLSNMTAPVTLRIDRENGFSGGDKGSKLLVLGYGATRLMPRKGMSDETEAVYGKVDNLFNPFVPVGDAETWLLGTSKKLFDDYARALKELFLVLDGPERLVRRAGTIMVETQGGVIPLSQLSDGYQSVVGVTADIMRIMCRYWPAMEIAEGIVLIDELGSHLHPRWRMRVVAGLRHAFPRVQFIASTHDPLCLRGLEPGEVIVFREDPSGETWALTDVPPVNSMRVDQLLTSEHFGLYSTIDPSIDATFGRYLDLRDIERPTAEEAAELARIKAKLDQDRVLGEDRRERLMLEAIDRYLSQERQEQSEPARQRAREDTLGSLLEIWKTEVPTPIEPADANGRGTN